MDQISMCTMHSNDLDPCFDRSCGRGSECLNDLPYLILGDLIRRCVVIVPCLCTRRQNSVRKGPKFFRDRPQTKPRRINTCFTACILYMYGRNDWIANE